MSSINHRHSKRRRRKPAQAYQATPSSTAEERFLQQAIANSKIDRHRPADGWLNVPTGPTFYPTVEEFEGNPLHYIDKIRPVAEKYGICKIVPPEGWDPPFCVDTKSTKKFQTKEQMIHRLQEGISFGDGKDYTAAEYQKMASEQAKAWKEKYYPSHCNDQSKVGENRLASVANSPQSTTSSTLGEASESGIQNPANSNSRRMTPENLERDYWSIVETQSQELAVDYGNDVDTSEFGSGFPASERGRSVSGKANPEKVNLPDPKFGTKDFYKETGWNLNNIPCCPESILRHVKVGINGINVPWMYYGCLFSTFCWHNEDNHLYSINYHHSGAPKQWYGIPGTRKDAEGLERVFRNYLSMKMRDEPDLLHHITTMFSPRLLQNGGVPVYKLLQHAKEFVVTFPRSFHGGFSMGPNIGEAVNFATHDWIAHGADANERYRSFARPAVFSHDRLTFTMANHIKEQKTYNDCKLLLAELQRVVEEELRLRRKLMESGVRDVSGDINLPKNRLDQLDEESADYDDKRLCHACKHVCFFSAVACECSQSKVSCLRHSHYMCRCPTERKYLMIWSKAKEMANTLETVERFCESLKKKPEGNQHGDKENPPSVVSETTSAAADSLESSSEKNGPNSEMPAVAPGSIKDWNMHKDEEIDLTPAILVDTQSLHRDSLIKSPLPSNENQRQLLHLGPGEAKRMKLNAVVSSQLARTVSSDVEGNGTKVSDGELSDEVVVIETRAPPEQ